MGSEAGITGILFDPAVGGVVNGATQTIFASSYGNGVYESTNGGATWKALTGGPIDVEYAGPSRIDGRLLCSWQRQFDLLLELRQWHMDGNSTASTQPPIQSVAVDPSNPNEVVAETPGGGT